MQPAGMSESHRPAQHRRPGEMDIARFAHDRFVKRSALAPVVFADEDAQEHCVAREGHDLRPYYAPSGETPNSQSCSQKASTAQNASPMTMAPAVALHFGSG